MKRAAQERERTLRVWRQHLKFHGPDVVLCVCEFQPGRFRKGQRIAGCGNPQCYLCHGDKLLNRPSRRQLQADALFRDGLQESLAHG